MAKLRTQYKRRAGFTFLEISVATVLFGLLLTLIAMTLHRTHANQQQFETRRTALLAVSNVLERMEVDAATRPEAGAEAEIPLPDEIAKRFKTPKLVVRAVADESLADAIRLDAELSWRSPNGTTAAPVRLSTFCFDLDDTDDETNADEQAEGEES